MSIKKKKINVAECANEITGSLKKGAFITTKAGDKINTMAIGWGHLGRIWERDLFVAYVRDCRFTFDLLEKNPEFTINVPINGFDSKQMAVCGSKSGRDTDKIKEAGLTPIDPEVITVPGIKEFPLTLECRVIYKDVIESAKMPAELKDKFYTAETSDHTAFYGEIVAAYIYE